MGLESSKAVHHIRVCEAAQHATAASKIEFIAWSRNVAGEGRWRRREGQSSRRQEKGILLDGDRTSDVVVDLPHELTFLEVETALPKLSPLPVSGGSGLVFGVVKSDWGGGLIHGVTDLGLGKTCCYSRRRHRWSLCSAPARQKMRTMSTS
jgi:hypothetical protein